MALIQLICQTRKSSPRQMLRSRQPKQAQNMISQPCTGAWRMILYALYALLRASNHHELHRCLVHKEKVKTTNFEEMLRPFRLSSRAATHLFSDSRPTHAG